MKVIHQHHLDEGIKDVIAGKRVMQQSLFNDGPPHGSRTLLETMTTVPPQVAVYALGLAGAALILALIALVVVLLRWS